jgi:hypothetical protein
MAERSKKGKKTGKTLLPAVGIWSPVQRPGDWLCAGGDKNSTRGL